MRFGISSYVFHAHRLTRPHLEAVASHGFESVELFATRTHFDYKDARAVDDLAAWLSDTGLRLHSVHAPISEGYVSGVWGPGLSIAATREEQRARAVGEAEAALAVARRVPFRFLVVHVGTPDDYASKADDNGVDPARRSLRTLHEAASALGVRLALEIIPNRLSSAEHLVRLIDEDLELPDVGICMDFGHAHLGEGAVDAVETASGHLLTTHVHDNRGRTDDHLVPFEGTIDWPATLFATQKVGYDGVFLFELAPSGGPGEVLARARRAANRFEEIVRF